MWSALKFESRSSLDSARTRRSISRWRARTHSVGNGRRSDCSTNAEIIDAFASMSDALSVIRMRVTTIQRENFFCREIARERSPAVPRRRFARSGIARPGCWRDAIGSGDKISEFVRCRLNFLPRKFDSFDSTTFCVDTLANHDILMPTAEFGGSRDSRNCPETGRFLASNSTREPLPGKVRWGRRGGPNGRSHGQLDSPYDMASAESRETSRPPGTEANIPCAFVLASSRDERPNVSMLRTTTVARFRGADDARPTP